MQMRTALIVGVLGASFSGAVAAETSVTLYGTLDAGIIYQRAKVGATDANAGVLNHNDQSKIGYQGGQQSGSHWRLHGIEALGGGVSANVVLESGFTNDNGRSEENRLFNRQATVGVSTHLGSIDLGRQPNVASRYFGAIDPFALDFYTANMGSTFGAANTVRYDNTMLYQSPSFNGVQFAGGYSFNFDTGRDNGVGFRTRENNRAITAGLSYEVGPWALALSWDTQYRRPSQPRPMQAIFGVAYDFEVVKLSAAYGYGKDGALSGPSLPLAEGLSQNPAFGSTAGDFSWHQLKIKSSMVGMLAPVSATSSVFASVQRADPNKNLTPTNLYSLGAKHTVSQRTDVYAYGSYAQHHALVRGNCATTVGAGVRHSF